MIKTNTDTSGFLSSEDDQQRPSFFCKKHRNLVTKFCTYFENSSADSCSNRLLCAECELFEHKQSHASCVEPFSDILHNSICFYLEKITPKIEDSLKKRRAEHKKVLDEIDVQFSALEKHFVNVIREFKRKAINKLLTGSSSFDIYPEEIDKIKDVLTNKLHSSVLSGFSLSNSEFKEYLQIYNEVKRKLAKAKTFIQDLEKNSLDAYYQFKINSSIIEDVKKSVFMAMQPLKGDFIAKESKEINKGSGSVTVGGLAYLRTGAKLLVGDLYGNLNIYDANRLQLAGTVKMVKGIIKILPIESKNLIMVGMTDGMLQKIELPGYTASPAVKLEMGNVTLAYVESENSAACSGATRRIEFFSLGTNAVESKIDTESSVGSSMYISEKNWLAAGMQNGQIHIFSLIKKAVIQKINAHLPDFWIHALAYSGRYGMLVSGSGDGTAKIWAINANNVFELHKSFPKANSWVDTVIPVFDSDTLITLNGDKCVRSWKISTGMQGRQRDVVEGRARCALLIEDKMQIAVADNSSGAVKFVHVNDMIAM